MTRKLGDVDVSYALWRPACLQVRNTDNRSAVAKIRFGGANLWGNLNLVE